MKSVMYQLDITDVSAHLISVTLSFTPQSSVHELTLPAWIPGSYMIRDFARNIVAISACDKSGALELQQLDKQRWQIQCNDSPVTVKYQLYAYDLSVRAAYIDDEVAVLNPGFDVVINIQGDEPLVNPLQLDQLLSAFNHPNVNIH